ERRIAPALAQAFDRVRGVAEPRLGAEVETRHGRAPEHHERGAKGRELDRGMTTLLAQRGRSCAESVESLARKRPQLAFRAAGADRGRGRLAVDEPLANRVRSGRKQP